jgi:tetratricopeptide (TPR) repeat protein
MLRHTLVTALRLFSLSLSVLVAQDIPVPILSTVDEKSLPSARDRSLLQLAQQAQEAGLSSSAIQLFNEVIKSKNASAPDVITAQLGLATCLIERNKRSEAKAALKNIPDSPSKNLLTGLVAFLDNDLITAGEISDKLNLNTLSPAEVPWFHTFKALLANAKFDNDNFNTNLTLATQSALSEEQRQRIQALCYRASVISGKINDSVINALRDIVKNNKNPEFTFTHQRNLALALARQDKKNEALALLKNLENLTDTQEAEADLLCGLISGADSAEGRKFLKSTAQNRSSDRLRITAIQSLVAAASEAKPGDINSIANEVYDFLTKQREGQLSYECPRDPSVLDTIHLARAQLMYLAGNNEKARQAATELLKEIPASPLAREATRFLAIIAWSDASYRLASSYIDTLAEGKEGIPRDVLRMVSADCLYLAHDYILAEKAYASIQNETQGADIAYTAFHQRVLSLLSSSDDFKVWTQTTEIIEQAFQNKKIEPSRLWVATWCLLEDIRKANQPDIALQLLERLSPVITKSSIDFQLRFKWQRALITLANRDNIKAAKLADEIAASLERLPANAPADLKNNAPVLRGHIALLKARTALGSSSTVGLVELENLRKKYGKVPAAAASFLVEGRYLSSLGRHAEAQARFLELVKTFEGPDAALNEMVELGLYEAAEEANQQALELGETKIKEAIELFEKLNQNYPQSPLLFRVALRRAELLRTLGDFDRALLVLNSIIRTKPEHPNRNQAEMAKADCLFGLAELRRDRSGQLDRQKVALAAAAYENVAASWAQDPDILVEAQYKLATTLLERSKAENATDAQSTRNEARTLLIKIIVNVRSTKAAAINNYGINGRTWIARAILSLGNSYEESNDLGEAVAVYRLIPDLNRNLPAGEARLPGQAAAESKLASLGAIPNKSTK